VIRLTAVADKNVPLSEQKEYRSIFRFRIDEKSPEAAAEAAGAGTGYSGSAGSFIGDVIPTRPAGTGGVSILDETTAAETEGAVETEAFSETEAVSETEAAQETEPEKTPETQEAGTGTRSQVFQPDSSMYQVTLENGFSFLCNIPERMATTQAVEIRSEGKYELFLGDEELEWEADRQLRAFGQYRLVSEGHEFTFEIINTYVNRDSYIAPAGMRITKASFNGEALDVGDGAVLTMAEDGSYELELEGAFP